MSGEVYKLDGIIVDHDSNLLLYGGHLYHEFMGEKYRQYGWISRDENSPITLMKSSHDGSYHLCLHNGELRFWGDNKNNQLGLGRVGYVAYIYYPTIIPCGKIIDFSCGESHILAISDCGILWACGNNKYGQLGVENIKESSSMTIVNMSVKKISCWGNNSCAINSNDLLVSWGQNNINISYKAISICLSYKGIITSNNSDISIVRYGIDNKEVLLEDFNPINMVSGLNFFASINNNGDLFLLNNDHVELLKSELSKDQDILAYANMLVIGNSDNYKVRKF